MAIWNVTRIWSFRDIISYPDWSLWWFSPVSLLTPGYYFQTKQDRPPSNPLLTYPSCSSVRVLYLSTLYQLRRPTYTPLSSRAISNSELERMQKEAIVDYVVILFQEGTKANHRQPVSGSIRNATSRMWSVNHQTMKFSNSPSHSTLHSWSSIAKWPKTQPRLRYYNKKIDSETLHLFRKYHVKLSNKELWKSKSYCS
jgi:hypothetical protein